VLVLTRDTVLPLLSEVMVAIVTTNIRGIPSEVVVDEADGVPRRSAINLDNIHTVPKQRVRDIITRLSRARLDEVCEALRFATACG
jgi:mRNA interferase MazF